MEKEKGNKLFKKQEYALAVECYAKAMELDPGNAVLPANRAMALLKMERYAAAEVDCGLALELDGGYVKAYLRRATARTRLNNYAGAREDFESVLKIEPGHKLAVTELERLDKEIGTSGLRYIRAVRRPPHLRSKKPLKRIVVEDIGLAVDPHPSTPDPTKDATTPTTISNTTSTTSTTISNTTSTNINISNITSTNTTPTNTPADGHSHGIEELQGSKGNGHVPVQETELASNVVIEEMEHCSPNSSSSEKVEHSSSVRASAVRGDHNNTVSDSADSGSVAKVPRLEAETSTRMVVAEVPREKSLGEEGCKAGGRDVLSGGGERGGNVGVPPVPSSSMQFQADWKRLGRDRSSLAQYFKAISISKYPLLLQQSLETDVFNDIIGILHEDFVRCGVSCLEELTALTKVKRFSVAVMFLLKKQKLRLGSLFEDLQALMRSDGDKHRLSALAREFCVLSNY